MMLWEIRNKTRELCTFYLFTKNHLFFRENWKTEAAKGYAELKFKQ
jgi:hypothetical protein